MKRTIFSGCATALITPFTDDGKAVDYASFEKLVEFQLKKSVDALVVAGTTGEAPVLSASEKSELIRIAKRNSCGNVPLIAGTGSNNTEEAVRKSNDAEKEGVNGLLIVTPYYNKCSQEGLIKHYFYIADRVSSPIIVYNVPSRTGMTINADTYKALSEHKNIVAVKEASGNFSEINKAINSCSGKLDFYSGNDDQTVSMMSVGAKGVISVASNIIPQEMHMLTSFCLKGDFMEARKLNERYNELFNLLFCDINPIPVKYAYSVITGCSEIVRLPLTALNETKKGYVYEILKRLSMIS